MSNDPQINVPRPDPRLFKFQASPDTTNQILSQPTQVFLVKTIEYTKDKGILLHYQDLPFPQKGFPYPEVIWAMNVVKRFMLGYFRWAKYGMYFMWPFIFLPKKLKVKFINTILHSITFAADYAFERYYINPDFYCPAAKEIAEWTYKFLVNIGADHLESSQMAQVMAMIMEYDNAYRYRVQDMTDVTSTEALKENPAREIRKMVSAISTREPNYQNTDKFSAVGGILTALFLVPSLKKAFIDSVPDISKIQLDEADRYHCLFRIDYNYEGRTFEDRFQELLKIHEGKVPVPYTVQANPQSSPVDQAPAESQS